MPLRTRLALLAILLLAFAVRAGGLEAQGIWGDEAFSVFTAKQDLAYVTGPGVDVHPPLYHLLLHVWLPLAGLTPFAVRWLSLAASLVSVSAAFVLARQVAGRGGAIPPLLAALLAALSPFQVIYAEETRMYAQAAAFSALSLAAFIGWHRRGGRRALVGWIAATLPALYSHYFAFFVLGAQDLFLLVSLRRDRARARARLSAAALAHLVMAAAFFPWVRAQVDYLSQRANARTSTLSLAGVWDVARQSLGALFAGITLDGVWAPAAALFCLALALLGLWAARRMPYAWLMALAIGVPIAGAMAVNPLLPYFRERFMLPAAVPFALLMAAGVRALPRLARPLSLAALGAIAVLALMNFWTVDRYHKGEYDRAIGAIRAEMRPGDAVVIYMPVQEAIYDYYRIDGLPVYAVPGADLAAAAAAQRRIWLLLYGDPAVYDPQHGVEQFLSARGFKSFYQGYRDGALARYDMAADAVTLSPAQARLGESIALSGFALPPSAARGETLPVALQWRADVPLAEDYTVFAHLLAPDGHVVAQMDSQPAGGTRPTRGWKPGEPVRDQIGVSVPADAPPGLYRVEVGMYLLRTLQRLPVRDAGGLPVQGDALIIGTVEVR